MNVEADGIPFSVVRRPDDQAQVARRGEPVTFGVPLPRGATREATGWAVTDTTGAVRPVQADVLERWPDGSIRWLLVDARVDADPGRPAALRLIRRAAAAAPQAAAPALHITTDGPRITVDTGAATFVLGPGAGGPMQAVHVGGRPVVDPGTTGIELTDPAGLTQRLSTTALTVLRAGPQRTRVGATLTAADGPLRELAFFATLDFFGGLTAVRFSLCVRNPRRAEHPGGFWDLGDPGSLLIKDLSLVLGLSERAISADASVDPGAAWSGVDLPFEVYQDSSGGANWRSTNHINRERRVPTRFQGYRVRSGTSESNGLRATPVLRVHQAAASVSVSVPHFWQNFPRALDANERGITVRFFPRQFDDVHELQGGEQKTHVCYLAFGNDEVTAGPLEWTRAPLLAQLDPEWHMAAGSMPWLAPDEPAHAALVRAAVEGPDAFTCKREVIDQFGWRHFGEVYGDHEAVKHTGTLPLVSHYNNQYDTVGGFLNQFLRTGDARWWTMADELAAHVIDVDIYHTDRDKWAYNNGLFWHTYHYGDADTCTHRSYPRSGLGAVHGGGPSPQHVYTSGLMFHYFLTGDEASRQAVLDLARFVHDADDGGKTVFRWLSRAPTGLASASGSIQYHGPGRGSGNSLNALLDGHRVSGDARLLAKAEAIIRRVVHPDEDVSANRLDDPENRWFYLMFLQSLGKYLARKVELGELDAAYAYARGVLRQYARWMADHEYPYLMKPERLEHPTESWAAHEARKSDVFVMAALHSDEPERSRFLERAHFFFRYAVDTLAGMPTRALARPVIVLLSSGLLLPWLAANPGATAPRPVVNPPSDERVPFVPQRVVATRRATWLAAAGGAGLLALTVLLLRG